MNDFSSQEKLVDQYVEQDRTDEAVALLFQLISKYAKEKDFPKAEALRDKLFDVDSMALHEIIKSAEIIEEEKSEAVDKDHMEIWADLYDNLTTEDANTLYFSLKKTQFEPEEALFKQGEKNDRLYFINSGQLKLVYRNKDAEKLIKTLDSGSIAGCNTFFTIIVCTTSLIANTRVNANYLEKETFLKWKEENAALASKIEVYCEKQIKEYKLLQKKGINRREYRRIKITGLITFQVLNRSGQPIGKSFRGELSDISLGGVSFFIKTANPRNALMLLGRKMRVKFTAPVGKHGTEIDKVGRISGVINHLFSDYSIHMKFDDLLKKLILDEMDQVPKEERTKTDTKVDRSAY